eukprot:3335371-Ditylum_brightwellii.AAC.1
MAGAFVELKHDTLLSFNASRNVDSAHKVNSGAVTDTGEHNNFLRIAPKDVPESTFSSTDVAATSKKSNKKHETITSASTSTAAEDSIREHHNIEQERSL